MGGILPDQKCFGLRIWSVLYVVSIYLVDIAVMFLNNSIELHKYVSLLLFAELSLCVLLPHRQLISVSSSVPHSVRFSWETSAFQSAILKEKQLGYNSKQLRRCIYHWRCWDICSVKAFSRIWPFRFVAGWLPSPYLSVILLFLRQGTNCIF